jgi:hypothetical protein
LWLGLTLLIAAAPAWAQSEEEVTAAVGQQLDAYTLCLKQHASDLAKSVDEMDAIVAKARDACSDERQALFDQLQQPPLNATPSDAADAVKQLDEALQPKMLDTVAKSRGG